jgi:hypothetical protein
VALPRPSSGTAAAPQQQLQGTARRLQLAKRLERATRNARYAESKIDVKLLPRHAYQSSKWLLPVKYRSPT